MEKISLNISKNIFRTKTVEKTQGASTNPFGVSFKGNVLTADVFETKRPSIAARVSNRSKLITSAIVGSINNVNNSISQRLNSIVSFGNRIKQNTMDTLDRARNFDLTAHWVNTGSILKSKLPSFTNDYSVRKLSKLGVTDLEAMLKQEISMI